MVSEQAVENLVGWVECAVGIQVGQQVVLLVISLSVCVPAEMTRCAAHSAINSWSGRSEHTDIINSVTSSEGDVLFLFNRILEPEGWGCWDRCCICCICGCPGGNIPGTEPGTPSFLGWVAPPLRCFHKFTRCICRKEKVMMSAIIQEMSIRKMKIGAPKEGKNYQNS